MNKNIIKEHFTRRNVITILSVIFGLIIYFGKSANTAHQEYISKSEYSIDTCKEQNEELRHLIEMFSFMKDSITPSAHERLSLYNELVQMVPHDKSLNYRDKVLEAKNSILMDIARFSKFDILKKSDEATIAYNKQIELLLSEKRYVDILSEISITTLGQQRKFLEDKQGDLLLEHIGEIRKNIELNKYGLSLSAKATIYVTEENLQLEQEMRVLNKRFILHFTLTAILIIIWIIIFGQAFRNAIFIEKKPEKPTSNNQ